MLPRIIPLSITKGVSLIRVMFSFALELNEIIDTPKILPHNSNIWLLDMHLFSIPIPRWPTLCCSDCAGCGRCLSTC